MKLSFRLSKLNDVDYLITEGMVKANRDNKLKQIARSYDQIKRIHFGRHVKKKHTRQIRHNSHLRIRLFGSNFVSCLLAISQFENAEVKILACVNIFFITKLNYNQTARFTVWPLSCLTQNRFTTLSKYCSFVLSFKVRFNVEYHLSNCYDTNHSNVITFITFKLPVP